MQQLSHQPSLREHFNISRLAIKYARLTICFWLAVTVAGFFAFSSLKYALFPDITFPVVVVNAKAPSETVLKTETQLSKPIEDALKSLPKLDELSASIYQGQAVVNVLFKVGTNLEAATQAVQANLKQLSLPSGATFEVIPIDLNESPAISYAIKSDNKSLAQLTQIAQAQIIPEIAKLPGVRKVNLLGDAAQTATDNPQNQLSSTNFQTLVRFNGEDALAFQVIKRSKSNTLDVVAGVEKVVQRLQKTLPDVQLVLAETQANYIREATQATIDSLILAVILAILVIFPFLRSFEATLISALAIPTSLLGTCIVLAIAGINLETIVLLALALVIGIVVDDAIVDVENIARQIDNGETPREAALRGTDEIGLAVTASTLTIAAVFLPVAFMGGSVGQFFKPFGLTVSAAVLISLLVARTLSPVLAVYWLKPRREQNSSANPQNSTFNHQYRNLLRWSIHHRTIVVAIAILSFIAGIALIPLIPQGFIAKLDRGEFNISYTTALPKIAGLLQAQTPQTAPPAKADSQSGDAFAWISDIAKSPERLLLRRTIRVGKQLETVVLKSPEVESVLTTAGIQGEPNKGKLYVKLKHERQLSTAEVQAQIRTALPKLKGVTASVEDIPFVQTEAEKPLQIAIKGDDLNVVQATAQTLKTRVEKLPGFVDVELSDSASTDKNLSQIERLNGQRVIYLSANLSQKQGLEDAALRVEKVAQPLPTGITLQRWGSSAHSSDVLTSFGGTMTLALVCMLLVLIWLFRRLLEPLVIVLSLPLSLVGAMLALLLTQSDFGVISLIGLIFLLGLLNKNAILLMDYANQLRQTGKSREEAILETGIVRLRPILMTTASTILGMLPIALGWGAGAELRQPMAVAIIGGLITSSVLSLIVVPVFYTLLEDGWNRVFKRS